MTINDIITLANAGFSASQIAILAQAQTPEPAPAPAPAPAPEPAPAPTPISEQDLVQRIVQGIQQSNVIGSNLPQPESADTILASIINPKEDK